MATGNAIVDAGKLYSSMNSTSDHVLTIFPKIGSYFCCRGFKLLSLNPFVNNAIQCSKAKNSVWSFPFVAHHSSVGYVQGHRRFFANQSVGLYFFFPLRPTGNCKLNKRILFVPRTSLKHMYHQPFIAWCKLKWLTEVSTFRSGSPLKIAPDGNGMRLLVSHFQCIFLFCLHAWLHIQWSQVCMKSKQTQLSKDVDTLYYWGYMGIGFRPWNLFIL